MLSTPLSQLCKQVTLEFRPIISENLLRAPMPGNKIQEDSISYRNSSTPTDWICLWPACQVIRELGGHTPFYSLVSKVGQQLHVGKAAGKRHLHYTPLVEHDDSLYPGWRIIGTRHRTSYNPPTYPATRTVPQPVWQPASH